MRPTKTRHSSLWKRKLDSPHLALYLTAAYFVSGLMGNALTVYAHSEGHPVALILWDINKNVATGSVFLIMILSIKRGAWTLNDWGFTFDRRILISIAFMIATSVLMWVDKAPRSPFFYEDAWLFAFIAYASSEEFVVRVFLIGHFVKRFGDSRGGVLKAVLISSVVFTVAHIPIKTHGELQSIFVMSLLMGYIYHYTRSCLFPLYLHVCANTMGMSGFLGGAVTALIYALLALISHTRRKSHGQEGI